MKAQMEERIVSQPATQSQVVGEKECVDEIVATVSRQSGAWKKVKLGEVAESIQTGPFGSQLHQSDYSDNGTPVIMPKDIVDGGISTETIARVDEQHVERLSRHKVTEGEIVYSRRGYVGKCAYITKTQEGWLCGTGCLKVTINKSDANPKFIFYQLQKESIVGWLEKHAKGATMANLNTSILSDVPLELPSISIQNNIVDTLSRYDALIANYQRQIKLLEEAAQRLYKEWFVDLHFPGHENVKVTDGVPEGWEKKRLGDVADVNRDTIGKDFSGEINYIDLSSTKKGRIIARQKYDNSNAPGRARRIAHDGDIVWGMVRPNLKPYALVMNPYENDVFSTGFAVLTAIDVPFTYLYLMTTTDLFIKYLVNCTNGAAYPAVKPVHFAEAECNIPPKYLLTQFHNIVEPMVRKISLLDTQLTLLTESRDRLLPKLMSGETEL